MADHDDDFMDSPESGQAAVSLILMLGLFLLAVLGFAVDLTNVWFHRQAATAAADAACEAGATDVLAINAGMSLPAAGFTPGTASNCISSPSATMCTYASLNGYNGTGLSSTSASNSVSWTFPSSVSGVSAGAGAYSFITLTISENVKTYIMSLLTASHYQNINVSTTCGVTLVKEAVPMVVLNPSSSGAFTYSGGGTLDIVGGPSRGLQVNSSSATAVAWSASGSINLSAGGPSQTGSSIAIVGGPNAVPNNGSASGYNGGSTGSWLAGVLPVSDPFGSVGPPSSVKNQTPATTTSGTWVAYQTDGCPDHSGSSGNSAQACIEFGPGYYPSGLNLPNNYSTAIFKPGIYYLNGSLNASGSNTLRVAKPSGYQQTDGVMFYFLTGSLNVSGCSGCQSSGVNNVNATDLTCDGSSPQNGLGMPSTLYGNVLYGQCATAATYWDSGGDTTDSRGAPGSRGLLIFQAHSNTTQPIFSGSGALSFAGALYFHSTNYSDVLSLSGGSSSGTLILGEIVVDQVNLSGSGLIKLALNPVATTSMSKVAIFN